MPETHDKRISTDPQPTLSGSLEVGTIVRYANSDKQWKVVWVGDGVVSLTSLRRRNRWGVPADRLVVVYTSAEIQNGDPIHVG